MYQDEGQLIIFHVLQKQTSLGYSRIFAASFFYFFRWKGQKELHHVPLTPLSLLACPETSSVFHLHCDQKPSGGQESRKWRGVAQDREMSSASQGGCQSRHLDWEAIELVMTGVEQYQTVFYGTMSEYTKTQPDKTEDRRNKKRETSKPNISSWEPFSLSQH